MIKRECRDCGEEFERSGDHLDLFPHWAYLCHHCDFELFRRNQKIENKNAKCCICNRRDGIHTAVHLEDGIIYYCENCKDECPDPFEE